MFWKVRAMPWRMISCRGIAVMSRPAAVMRPLSASNTRVITLNTEVFPAPLGPMIANTSPRSTEKVTPRSAWMPPKASDTSSTVKKLIAGLPTVCVGMSLVPLRAHVGLAAAVRVAAVQREGVQETADLQPAAVQPARLEQHEQHQHQAEDEDLQP